MRFTERLTRLEQREGANPRMTSEEIEGAASRYEQALLADGDPRHGSIAEAMTIWRQMVATAPTWAQRVYANAEPWDLVL